MTFLIKLHIVLYILLTLFAVIYQISTKGFHWIYLGYVLSSGALILSIISYEINVTYLTIGLIGLILTAITYGYLFNILHWSHVTVRIVISIVIVFMATWAKK